MISMTGDLALWVETAAEATQLNQYLHCGFVVVGDDWDTDEAWPDPDDRALARRILVDLRAGGPAPTEAELRQLANCCRQDNLGAPSPALTYGEVYGPGGEADDSEYGQDY